MIKPGLIRYEGENETLNDYFLNDGRKHRLIQLSGKQYLIPKSPYEALYFLPTKFFSELRRKHAVQKNYDFFAPKIIWEGRLIREMHAGLWFREFTEKVVPVENIRKFLIHH